MYSPELVHHFLEQSAGRLPEKTAVVHEDQRITYGDLDEKANAVAQFLKSHGIKPAEHVALLFENSIEYIIAYYGILKSGAVAVPLSSDLKTSNLQALLEDVHAVAVITSGRFERLLSTINWQSTRVRLLLVTHPKSSFKMLPLQVHRWEDVVHNSTIQWDGVEVHADDLASIIYTSGSTGVPKGVMLTHRNIVANTKSICSYLELSSDDIQMVVLPFFYVMGKSLLNTHVAVGGTVVLNNKFAFPADVLNQMKSEGVTGFSGVPSTYTYLMHRSPLSKYRDALPSLRYCSQAGGHMPKKIKEALLKTLPSHTRLIVMYGATEASARLTYVPPFKLADKMDSIGIPIPGVEMAVVDEQGRMLANGEMGELVARGSNIMKGYWNSPNETLTALRGGVYHTGDLGYRDDEGYFYVLGRKDGLVKVGGHRINPLEVEDALIDTDLLIEAVVMSKPDPLLGNRLIALAVAKESLLRPNDILAKCSDLLPRYKLPNEVKLVRAIPKNRNGKVDKDKCMAMIA